MQNKEIEEDAKELLEFFKFWLVHGWIPAVRTEQVERSKQMLENILQYIDQLENKVKEMEE